MPTLKSYHRPDDIQTALDLLARPDVKTGLIAGGTYINARRGEQIEEVVDLQALGLNGVSHGEGQLTLGAMVRLQSIVTDAQAPPLLRETARREGPNTFRNAATIGGVVVGGDAESELLAALLVFEAEVTIETAGGVKTIALASMTADPFNKLRAGRRSIRQAQGRPPIHSTSSGQAADISGVLENGLVTSIALNTDGATAAERVARTPADKPIVAAVGRLGADGQLRLALCGVAAAPILVDPANPTASLTPPGDFRGSSAYRLHTAAVLAKRVVEQLVD